jgi:ribosome-associated protein
MERIANQLLARSPADRAPLQLPTILTVTLTEHPRLTGTARNRNMRRLKGLLRAQDDIDALEEALSEETEAERRAHMLERWRTRLLNGDDTDLQAFVDQHPSADRSAIRTLIRTAKKSDEKGSKASKKLFQVLKSAPPAASE